MKPILNPLIVTALGAGLVIGGSFMKTKPKANLAIETRDVGTFLPVINNTGGEFLLFKTKITNKGNNTVKDVIVDYQIPDVMDWETATIIDRIYPGQTAVVGAYPDLSKLGSGGEDAVAEVFISWGGKGDVDAMYEEEIPVYIPTGGEVRNKEVTTRKDVSRDIVHNDVKSNIRNEGNTKPPSSTTKPPPKRNNDPPKTSRESGSMSFNAPQGWQVVNNPYPAMREVKKVAFSADQMANVTLYEIPHDNMKDAMMYLSEILYDAGSDVEYQISGNTVSGTSYSQLGAFLWKGKGRKVGSNYQIVATGASEFAINNYRGVLNSVYNSIR